jgi:nitrous oxide reductase accessory protein NosL
MKGYTMKRLGHRIPFVLLCLLLSYSAAFAAPPAIPAPQAKDKCPVCGMFVSKYPDWVVGVTFTDSTALHFDGIKDFFTYYHNMQKYTPSKKQTAILAIVVHDYYTLKPIDARQSFFVIGSDVYGPMGKELVPFGKATDAQAFFKDHKGKKVLSFGNVTPAILKSME